MALSILNNKWLMRLFVALSTFYGFWFIFNMDPYLPVRTRFIKGLWWTGHGHLALWLATLKVRGLIRYPLALILFISLIGLFLLWWNVHLIIAGVALLYSTWILVLLVRGKNAIA